ncbi:hypothetical protein TcCL_ESM08081 [Trypanosoma cruzi]|uniref:Uncharacterized protein n=2 Tax=Trypanosoma cruzi TaxID=5693 RepID=Q4CRK0_TRYCC|nr:uncharacterized protein Tc00.1047053505229.20 [Trypanosoma cruzi]EAN82903.1 hypothetical protein, conserved [Trypanosoma cruzi]RNC54478.1 hypothetical protein TcCL_ESM08081 [Trypanosoma cruzi]|eukprot:XP_804754.1 hypothetical protein Tc00.1047053505229.20 [Trypanosoma cruzi strain CL Brener]
MYSKGRDALRRLDMVLASLRQGALKETRATREEVKRSLIREDVHRQNEERRQQQQQQLGIEREMSSSPSVVRVGDPSMASGGFSTSSLLGCGGNDKSTGMGGAKGLPAWYDEDYTTAPRRVEKTKNGRVSTADCDERESSSGGGGDAKLHDEESAMVVDVTQRVSQAERKLYPILLADVAECASADEKNRGGNALDVGGSEVIEWDDRGAPVRLRSTWMPVSPQTLVPVSRTADESKESARSDVMHSGRTSAATTTTTTTTKQTISSDKKLCTQLHEYAWKEDPLAPMPMAGRPAEEGPSPPPVGLSGTSGRGAVNRMRQALPFSPNRGNSTRRRNRPPLSTEGTAVAESSASAIARQIRQAVVKQPTASVDMNKKKAGSESFSSFPVVHGSSGRCSVLYEPDEAECVITHVLNPVTAFFCTSCGACVAREIVTGEPNSCTACGEPFEALPPLPSPRLNGCLLDTVVTETKNVVSLREEGVPAGISASVKKCTATTSTMTTTTTTTTSTTTRDISTMPMTAKVTAGTQAGTSWSMPPLAATAVQGLYFLHLWDQATALHHK